MSLAMFAAPFNENSNIESMTDDSDNIMNKKRQPTIKPKKDTLKKTLIQKK